MEVIIDTNVLISGVFWKGLPYKILDLFAHDRIRVLATKRILKEYFEVLNRLDKSGEIAKKWQHMILGRISIIEEKTSVKLSRDAKDDIFVNCALSARAKYLISGDQDLLVLKTIFRTKVVTPAQFLKNYRAAQ